MSKELDIEEFQNFLQGLKGKSLEERILLAGILLCRTVEKSLKLSSADSKLLQKFITLQGYIWFELHRSTLGQEVKELCTSPCSLGWAENVPLSGGVAWYVLYHGRRDYETMAASTQEYIKIAVPVFQQLKGKAASLSHSEGK